MTRITRVSILFICTFILIALPGHEVNAQPDKSITISSNTPSFYVKRDSLIKYDKEKILDFRRNGPIGDSLKTLLFCNKLWFLFRTMGNKGLELLSIDLTTRKLKQVTRRSFNREDNRLFTVKVFENQLFVTTNFSETDHVWDSGMLLIDEKNDREERYIPVKRKSFLRDVHISKDSLYIVVEPKKAEFNISHYIFFFMTKERPEKYMFIKTGECELFVYDRNFALRRHSLIPKCEL